MNGKAITSPPNSGPQKAGSSTHQIESHERVVDYIPEPPPSYAIVLAGLVGLSLMIPIEGAHRARRRCRRSLRVRRVRRLCYRQPNHLGPSSQNEFMSMIRNRSPQEVATHPDGRRRSRDNPSPLAAVRLKLLSPASDRTGAGAS